MHWIAPSEAEQEKNKYGLIRRWSLKSLLSTGVHFSHLNSSDLGLCWDFMRYSCDSEQLGGGI